MILLWVTLSPSRTRVVIEYFIPPVLALASCLSAAHALLFKRSPVAAWSWIVCCLSLPLAGPLLYWTFGRNRIRTGALPRSGRSCPEELAHSHHLRSLSDRVTRHPLTGDNSVRALVNGEQAFPAMLEAISQAKQSISLATYLFQSDSVGTQFVEALGQARERGVDVRVLVDGLGEWYSRPRISAPLRSRGIRVQRFLPPTLLHPHLHLNLRNHRKLLLIDEARGFTGGMNLSRKHLGQDDTVRHPALDIHFEIHGPVVRQMQEVFEEDWRFVTGEPGVSDPSPSVGTGPAYCRAVPAGPNEDFQRLHWLILGLVNSAQKRVRIMTPYFVPHRELISSLVTAVLRGVEVEILLPSKNNLPLVAWAGRSFLWELVQYGVKVGYQPPPFHHTKILLIDDDYSLVGSANLDPRSLRLNFEFNLEAFDESLARTLHQHFETCFDQARSVRVEDLESRPLLLRMRDSLAKLASPFL